MRTVRARCVLPCSHPSYALIMSAFIGRVEGERALHLPLGSIDVVTRWAGHLVACSRNVGCESLQQPLRHLFRSGGRRHACTSRSIMPPLSTFHSPDSRSLALADSWKHSDFPAGTVKPKDAARPTRQPRRSRHLRDITPGCWRRRSDGPPTRRAGGPRGGQFSGRKRHFMRVFATSLHLFTPLTFIFNRLNQITPPSCAAAHATLDHPRRFRRLSHGPTPKSAVYVTVLQVTQTIRAARLTPSIAASRGDVDEGGGASGGGRGKDGGHLGGGANGGEVNSCGGEGGGGGGGESGPSGAQPRSVPRASRVRSVSASARSAY